jgi:esterase/lipase
VAKHRRISIGGRSLGTAIATHVAAKREVFRLALITPFDSILNVAQGRYPIYPVQYLLDDHYMSIDNIPSIKAQTFIVYAQNDTAVPFKYTKNLIDAFDKEQLKVTMIENRGHNDISDDDKYYKIMQDFINEGV